MGSAQVETPSGKDAAYENFPVGSWLLPADARPHVAVFYRFARAIDDIADNPSLDADTKIERLDQFAVAIQGEAVDEQAYVSGIKMRRSLNETDISGQHCLDLIDAFKQDAVKSRYSNWDELIHYCNRSAAPVGRYLIDLTGGCSDNYASSDALCNALQVINHLQDCKDDYLTMDRVYLPADWMKEAGANVEMLREQELTSALRDVIDRCLHGTRALMISADFLPGNVKSRRLAMESAAIVRIAHSLIRKLDRQDPLARRVKLSKLGYARCIFSGAMRGLFT